ncbi:AraC-like DNA-binding protein [Paenibacillus castaneae]|uniref:AraC family transcriptional regulator n=1 Tax=Paenibacillus castaneae TaxID=474957 RepID=UPI000C9A34F9|nr:AraC family transcriptional regulator [Paenibacillus castaneae]NIK77213.1 AraC-like DNA-binding protein [Paenibacillus castaneae]
MIEYLSRNVQHMDLHMNQYGVEQCSPGHFHGPAIRNHYLLHYVLSGEGTFEVGDQLYHLGQGQGFLICPDVVSLYQASFDNPWHYCWLGFNGLQAESLLKQANLTKDTPIFAYNKVETFFLYIEQMIQTKQMNYASDLMLTGLLYQLLAQLVEANPGKNAIDKKENRKEIYVTKVIDFVEMNYSNKFSIADIANFIGLDRSYLCSIYKERSHLSIQQYLILFRMNKAAVLLRNKELAIGDVARSVGYDDPLLFSKIFKKTKDVSPREYRSMIINDGNDTP